MLPVKIKLTDEIINNVKSARIAKRIPAAELSKAIKRDVSYISSFELKRLKTISAVDLTAIISYMFDIPEHKAIEKVERLISVEVKKETDNQVNQNYNILLANNKININNDNIFDIDNNDNNKNNQLLIRESSIDEYSYSDTNDNADLELISDMLDDIKNIISEFYKKEPKETVFILNSFIKTLKIDPSFTMKLMGMPFFTLKTLSVDVRIKILADLYAILKKYAAAVNPATSPADGGHLHKGKDE